MASGTESADKVVHRIGQMVMEADMSDHEWDKAIMVAEIGARKRMFGYCYWSQDGWQAATPEGFATLMAFQDLQEIMGETGREPWKQAKLYVDRWTRQIEIEFDYTGLVWKPSFADPERFAFSLLPSR